MIVKNFTLVVFTLALLTACQEREETNKKPITQTNNNIADNALTTNHDTYTDDKVLCVLMVRTGRRYFSGDREEYGKQKDQDYNYRLSMSLLSDNKYIAIVKTLTMGIDNNPAMIYNVIPSFKSCKESKAFLFKLHKKTYGIEAEFLESSLAEYVKIARGG